MAYPALDLLFNIRQDINVLTECSVRKLAKID